MDFLSLSQSDRVWGGISCAHRGPRRTKAIADPEPAKSAGARRIKKPHLYEHSYSGAIVARLAIPISSTAPITILKWLQQVVKTYSQKKVDALFSVVACLLSPWSTSGHRMYGVSPSHPVMLLQSPSD